MADLGWLLYKHTSFTLLVPWLKRPEPSGSSSEACARQTARAEIGAKFQARGSGIMQEVIRVVTCKEFGVQFLFPQNVSFLIVAYRLTLPPASGDIYLVPNSRENSRGLSILLEVTAL